MEQKTNDPVDSGKALKDIVIVQNKLNFTIQHFHCDQTVSTKLKMRNEIKIQS